jgi:ankyrin repeat protein
MLQVKRNLRSNKNQKFKNTILTAVNQHIQIINNYKSGDTPLISAVRNNDYNRVKELINKNVRINQKGRWNNTALHYAYNSGNIIIILLLLENGANPYLYHLSGGKGVEPKNYSSVAKQTHRKYLNEIKEAKQTYRDSVKHKSQDSIISYIKYFIGDIYTN